MAKGLEFRTQFKLDFFDQPAVKSMLDEKERRIMFKVLGDTRRKARREIKVSAPTTKEADRLRSATDPNTRKKLRRKIRNKRTRVSQPGQPPIAHTRTNKSIRFILFAYERERHTGVVGPVAFNAKGEDVPAVLAGGGTARISVRRKDGRRVRKSVRIAARPIPALVSAPERFASMWKER